jgi:WhiB family redox-sensing transcriptional regulator
MSTSTMAAGQDCASLPDWRDYAACRDGDPELFFPDCDTRSARTQVKTAKLICRGCPVQMTCLDWALASGQESGIWGGLTEDERRRLQRRGYRPRPDKPY